MAVFELFPGPAAVGEVQHPVFPHQVIFEIQPAGGAADVNVEPILFGGQLHEIILPEKLRSDQRAAKTEAPGGLCDRTAFLFDMGIRKIVIAFPVEGDHPDQSRIF